MWRAAEGPFAADSPTLNVAIVSPGFWVIFQNADAKATKTGLWIIQNKFTDDSRTQRCSLSRLLYQRNTHWYSCIKHKNSKWKTVIKYRLSSHLLLEAACNKSQSFLFFRVARSSSAGVVARLSTITSTRRASVALFMVDLFLIRVIRWRRCWTRAFFVDFNELHSSVRWRGPAVGAGWWEADEAR